MSFEGMALMALADLPEDDARGVTIRDGAKMRKFVVLRWKGETIVYRLSLIHI